MNCTVAASSGLFGAKINLQQPAAEVRTVHAFARVGEEKFLDHVADVIVVVGRGGAAAIVEMEWEINVHRLPHSAVTRVWVTAMISGVPVGAQIAWLLCTTEGLAIREDARRAG